MGMIGVFAQFEAELTAERTREGIKALQEQGYGYGAKPKLSEKQAAKLLALRKSGLSKSMLARRFKVSPATVTNYINRAKAKRGRK